ncbi:ABC transporter permease [candidate division WOR-3 bacterium]|nr:ABC transporter permease [candidate division WOR-3 bacterium]
MRKFFCVLKQEFKTVAMNKSFIVFTLLGPVFMIGITVFPMLLMKGTQAKKVTVYVVTEDKNLAAAMEIRLKNSGIDIVKNNDSREVLDSLVGKGVIYGYIIVPESILTQDTFEFVTKDMADYTVVASIEGVLGNYIITQRMIGEGIDPSKIDALTSPPVISAVKLTKEGEKVKQDFMASFFTAITFTMLLYMTILIYGQSIGRSVINEKKTKTVEIILSSVKPFTLMLGKISGQAAASLLQYGFWLSLSFFSLKIIGSRFQNLNVPVLPHGIYGYLISFYILGFLMYSAVYAALGAASEDENNLQQLAMPVIFLLILPMISVSAIIMNPNSAFAVFFSLFPFTAPMVMFLRATISSPPLYQIIIAYGLIVLTIFLLFFIAAKIFRIGILMTGKKFSFKDIMVWLRS